MYKGHCPHPKHKDNDPSFRVWADSRSWACMVCHQGKKSFHDKVYGSDCIAFVQWIENLSWKEAVFYLADKYNVPLPDSKHEAILKEKKNLTYSYMGNLKGKSLKYLLSRGLTEKDCFNWGLGYDGQKIVFPLLDRYRNVLGFTRRWIIVPEGAPDKYKNSSNNAIFNKSLYLYGIHNLDDDFEEIRITEGSLDVILAHKYGVKNITATLGTAFTDGHVELMKHYNKIPVFCMDGDPAGLKAINKSIKLLADNGIYSKLLILPDGKDMADMALELQDDLEEYIQDNAITYGNYLIQQEMNKYNAKVNELKLKHYPTLLKVLDKVPYEDERKILKSYIKQTMGIEI